jgi:hypothetical protein
LRWSRWRRLMAARRARAGCGGEPDRQKETERCGRAPSAEPLRH